MDIKNQLINNCIEQTTKNKNLLLLTIEDKTVASRYIAKAKKYGLEYIKNTDGSVCGYITRESIRFQ